MTTKNYKQRLSNLEQRRFSEITQKKYLSESFGKSGLGDSTEYALESMRPPDGAYTQNTIMASDKVETHLAEKLKEQVYFEHQGSVTTNTHIKVHSDIDLLVLTKKFVQLEHPQIPSDPYEGNTTEDLQNLRKDCENVLKGIYNEVDCSHAKAIQVFLTNPKRKVDVVVCNWVDTNDYASLKDKKYRGIQIYEKNNSNVTNTDFPFLHISNINERDKEASGGLKKLIRLLKNIKADAAIEGNKINLSSFEITSILYGIDSNKLKKDKKQELLLLFEAQHQLNKLINDSNYRENLLSPNGKERVFELKTDKILELKKMLLEISELIQDITEELKNRKKQISNELIYS